MTGKTPLPLVPKLRFPEFRNAGEWNMPPLKDLADPISEKVGTTKCVPMSVTTGVGLVSQEDKFGRVIAGDSYKNYIKLQKNDFAYNKSATKEFPQGYIARYTGTEDAGVPNSIFTCFRPDTDCVVPAFLDQLFHSNHHGRWLSKYITVGARAHGALSVSDDDLFSMPVPLPPDVVLRDEQQRIADCLGSLDDLIAAEGRKLEALRRHKQGLMQQLFPQPGETVPRLRFPEFVGGPAWKTRELGPLTTKVGSGATPRGGQKNYSTRGRPFMRSQNVGWGDLLLEDIVHINEDIHASLAGTELLAGDVLLNITGASIGRSAVVDARIAGGNVNQHVCIIRCKPDELHPSFLSQYLISQHGQAQIDNCQAGGGREGLNFGQIRSFGIPVPAICLEQERIADCLRAADECVFLQSASIDGLVNHKRGLLQRVFPTPEARWQA